VCHQCGAPLGANEVDASGLAPVPSPAPIAHASGETADRTAADRTPITFAEHFVAAHHTDHDARVPMDTTPAATIEPRVTHDAGATVASAFPRATRTSGLRGRTNSARHVAFASLAACLVAVGLYYAYLSNPARLSKDGDSTAANANVDSVSRGTPASGMVGASADQPSPSTTFTAPTLATAPGSRNEAADAAVQRRAEPLGTTTNDAVITSQRKQLEPPVTAAPNSRWAAAGTKRSTARDSSLLTVPANSRPTSRDRDAAATRRLIARDLAGFPPASKSPEDAKRLVSPGG
jgi:hypothetical protein